MNERQTEDSDAEVVRERARRWRNWKPERLHIAFNDIMVARGVYNLVR